MYAGLVDARGRLQFYDGNIRFLNSDGTIAEDQVLPVDYAAYISEASVPTSYLKAPYYKPLGYPSGTYRVGPLGRLNVAEACGTPEADAELTEYRRRFGRIPHSAFLFHYARLIELLYAVERLEQILEHPGILDTHVRAHAAVNALDGVGVIEAPRGILIHHYRVDEKGALVWANLIVATGHNNLALDRSVEQVSRHFVDGNKLKEGMLNRVAAVVRAYDPCLSCSTHAAGLPELVVELISPDGAVLDRFHS
jgi:NAD-reducing hydrogenase large subunit